jgi:hypothetical protein
MKSVVALLADGISPRPHRLRWTRKETSVEPDAISVRTDPKGSGEVSEPGDGTRKAGQWPVIRNVPKSLAASSREAAFFLQVLSLPTKSLARCGRPRFKGGRNRRDASGAMEAVRGAPHGDTTMPEHQNSLNGTTTNTSRARFAPQAAISRSVAAAFLSTTQLAPI